MKRLDEKYLLDMLLSARQARAYVEGMERERFLEDTRTQDAIIRRLEVIGEAASHVGARTREAHPTISWSAMAGMRNRLIHEYFRVDLEIVLQVVRYELADLVPTLEPLIPPEEEV